MTHDLTAPRVRIVSMLTCPNPSCARTIYSPTVRLGEAWLKCNIAEKHRRGVCPAHWFNLTLPPRASGLDLVRYVGPLYAERIVRAVAPILGDWYREPLASESDKPVHVQIVCRARDEHHLRYAPIADVLRSLQIQGV